MGKTALKNVVDYDSPWKQIIEDLFESFLEFFFPALHADIDFSRGYEVKSKELYKMLKEHEIGKRFADELIKVYLKDGSERWLLIHIEVQNYWEDDFAKRMYIYNYRIFDKYNHETVSLVILTDTDKSYRPDTYLQEGWGFEHKFKFPIIKLIDYEERKEALERSVNPMAVLVLAQLESLQLKNEANEKKYDAKLKLIRKLYKKGYDKQQIIEVFAFIDWIISLPKELEEKIMDEVIRLEEDEKMTYITSVERIGEERGEKRGEERGKKLGEKLGEKRGEKRGEKLAKLQIAEKMLEKAFSIDVISEVTGLSEDEILTISKKPKSKGKK